MLHIKNSVGVSLKKALYKNALICSVEVSSLQISKVLIIGTFPVRFKYMLRIL